MTTRTRRRYEGPLSVDPRIARLFRVHLRLPRVLVEDIARAQCYTEMLRFANGSREEISFVNGKTHGTVRRWYSSGSRASEISYVYGKRYGTATYWHADGSRECDIPYVNGKWHGTARWWRTDGSRCFKVSYVYDKAHGTATWWYADGSREMEITYENGEERTGQ